MEHSNDTSQPSTPTEPRWQPINAIQRRVLGVLVEKAKTTPAAYPMTLNALINGCNQKSNRAPLMQVEDDAVDDALFELRKLGAVGEVLGGGRVAKYRHYIYEWLGVDRLEAAVMAELLLRGAQTVGELRVRVARMEPVADLAALQPVLSQLKSKGLVLPLTPEGRGYVVTHALYLDREMDKVRSQFSPVGIDAGTLFESDSDSGDTATSSARPSVQSVAVTPASNEIRGEVEQLKSQVAEMRDEIEKMTSLLDQTRSDIDRLKSDLGV